MADAVHNTRDAFYRTPFGAAPCGTRVFLRLRVDAALEDARVSLKLWSSDKAETLAMECVGIGGMWRTYEASFSAPQEPGLVWYHFMIETGSRMFYFGNADDGMGGHGRVWDDPPPSFQVTVYDGAFATPQWMPDGIVYQIFPDRFFDGHDGALLARRQDIRVHERWDDAPDAIDERGAPEDAAKDFFGGNLRGIREKLDHLQSLSVSALYLNPIFKANSNHKYDTGDYTQIDSTFGDEEEFRALCAAAKERGIRVLLDGVFSHTGEDSAYFNRFGNYDSVGAHQSALSRYFAWYKFNRHPDDYVCWWGVPTLPEINEMWPSFLDFIIRSPDAVVAKWLRAGAGGWRLDVADELPDEFIAMLRERVKAEDADACVIGEVWEDATNKVAYGQPRKYALGRGLDSVMNYPLRLTLIAFLTGQENAALARRRILVQKENYPKPMYYALMNLMGSHDRTRILNVLADRENPNIPAQEMGGYRLTSEEYALGAARLRLMIALVAGLPGMPSVYYGDEAGVQGLRDPFCRAAYPWGREDGELLDSFRKVLAVRRHLPVLRRGEVDVIAPHPDVLCVLRSISKGRDALGEPARDATAFIGVNRSGEKRRVVVDIGCETLITPEGVVFDCPGGMLSVELAPMSALFAVDGASKSLLEKREG